MRLALPVVLALLVLPGAAAQFRDVPATAIPGKTGGGELIGGSGIGFTFSVETVGELALVPSPWFLAGHDTVVNLTGFGQGAAWNGSWRVNVTGATVDPQVVSLSIPATGSASAYLTVHPEDIGTVDLTMESIDAFYAGGEPVKLLLSGPSIVAPSVRFLDPPVEGASEEDPEFEHIDTFGGSRSEGAAYARVRPGDPLAPRVQVRNDLPVSTPAFDMTLEGGVTTRAVEVRSLAPGESITVDLPPFTPMEAQPGGGRYFGPMGRIELRVMGQFSVGGASVTVPMAGYEMDKGAVVRLTPAVAIIDIQEGLAIDLLVPRDPRLGVPTRVKINATNAGSSALEGSLVVNLQTPNGLYYEVQGPEVRTVRLDLAPGEATSESIEFTPRVTGQWSVSAVFQSSEGFGYGGGGGGFIVEGPVRIDLGQTGVVYARIGETVRVDVTVTTEKPLQGAELRVTSGQGYYGGYYDASQVSGGEFRPGLMQTLLVTEASTSSLGTLRPGGALNATLEVKGRASGGYQVVPYVIAEGFAYTTRPYDPAVDGPMFTPYGYALQIAVQPRALPAAMGLLPLTVGLAVFVGLWTFRTRFVR